MASEIRTRLSLDDNMSPSLGIIATRVNNITNRLERIGKTATRVGSTATASANSAQRSLNSVSTAATNAGNAANNAAIKMQSGMSGTISTAERVRNSINQFDSGFAHAKTAVESFVNQIKGITTTGIERVKNVVQSVPTLLHNGTSAAGNFANQIKNLPTSAMSSLKNGMAAASTSAVVLGKSLQIVAQTKISNAANQVKSVYSALSQGQTGARGFLTALQSIGKVSVVGAVNGVRNIGNVVTNAINKFKTLGTQISNVASGGVTKLKSSVTTLSSKISSVAQVGVSKFKQFSETLSQVTKSGNGLVGTLGRIAAAIGGIQAAKGIINLSDTLTSTTARLDLMNDGQQTTAELQEKIAASAKASRGAYLDTADAVAKMGVLAGNAFSSNDELIEFTELVNKNFAIAGTTTEGQAAAMLQLTQAMGSGVLRGEELNSILEQAPTITQTIADSLGVSVGELRNMASEGKITSTVVKDALLGASDEINARFESMPLTFGQIWTQFKNDAIIAFQPVLDKLSEIANSEGFKQWVQKITDSLAGLAEQALNVVDFFINNWSTIAPIIETIIGTVIALNVVMEIFTTVITIATLAEMGLLLPILLVVAAIAAIVAIIVVIVNYWNEIKAAACSCAEAIKSRWGSVCDWFSNLWNSIVAAVTGAVEKIKTVWNSIVSFFSQIGQAIWNVISPLVTAIWNLISTLFSTIYAIISAIMQGIWATIVNVWNSIVAAILPILQTIWNGITSVWNSIWETISGVLSGILSTITGVWNSIVSTVSGKVSEIYNSIKSKFDEALNFLSGLKSQFVQKGKDMIEGLVNGISSKINAVTSKIKELGEKVVSVVKSFFNIGSPSKVMFALGEFVTQGFQNGLVDRINDLQRTAFSVSTVVENGIADPLTSRNNLSGTRSDFSTIRQAPINNTQNSRVINAPVTVNQKNEITVQNGEDTDTLIRKMARGLEDNISVPLKEAVAGV